VRFSGRSYEIWSNNDCGTEVPSAFRVKCDRSDGEFALFHLLLIMSRVFVGRIYNNAMLSDLFSLLDGAYRIHSGPIIHRDFSSPLGLSLGFPIPRFSYPEVREL
jgi:hypothetical protein